MDTNGITPAQSSDGSVTRFERYDCSGGCPVEAALEIIAHKWKGLIVWHLLPGPLRFSALQRACGTVSQRVLTKALRDLEADGILIRTSYPEVPPRVEYTLTHKGAALGPALSALKEWGETHGPSERGGEAA